MPNNQEFQVNGTNNTALFSLKLYRGDGMTLLAMNWKIGEPPMDFVGFAIEYKEPNGNKFFSVKNRLAFPGVANSKNPNKFSTLQSPIQKFRWVHFPRNAELSGLFSYRVTPVFMNSLDELSYGEPQIADIALRRETYPNVLNVGFTRGFVSSQAFVDKFGADSISKLIPNKANVGLSFVPTFNNPAFAYNWMGFEARTMVLDTLDKALLDKKAEVFVVAYDLNVPEIVEKLEQLGNRLKIIIDDSSQDHGKKNSAESIAEKRLVQSAGRDNVLRQNMDNLQHNKTIVVSSPDTNLVICGSTNFSWRGLFIQANNAILLHGKEAVNIFTKAFENYWNNQTSSTFGLTNSAVWQDLNLPSINAKIAFSPHIPSNALLNGIAEDISNQTTSTLFYSLAFLYQTPGVILDAIEKVTNDSNIFVYGMSDKKVGGIEIQKPDGNIAPVSPSQLSGKNLPEPFKSEPIGGGGIRLHHKFVVIDFDKPTARVYMGSYNFSKAADNDNGENLIIIKDKRIAISYMIEGLRLFDHYHFRANQEEARKLNKKIELHKPPKNGAVAWWKDDFTEGTIKYRDRLLFA